MTYGYNGKVLRVDLTRGRLTVEEPEENFYRTYFGGRGFVSYYLLKELEMGVEPLGPENKLVAATGIVTGAPVGGCGRNSIGAKSPLTGGYGDAEVGGYWGAELKRAGYDAIVIDGRAEEPVYLWIEDGQAELRAAGHLWGRTTAESQRLIREELGDPLIRTSQIGPAGEKLVRYACVINDLHHAAGRTGMGAVMGSKNLKAIAVRGRSAPEMAEPDRVRDLARWLRDNFRSLIPGMHDLGTASGLLNLNQVGGLPTRNFQDGTFAGAPNISGPRLRDTILVARRSCWACPVRCKREVAMSQPYQVDPGYGGPEYETLASLGSNCGIDDLAAIAKGNELCNAYGLDTISAGAAIAFAMECFERGVLTERDSGGLRLSFGDAEAMLKLVGMIARREGIGQLLGEGVARAAQVIGSGVEEFAIEVKGQEVPMHEPRYKQGLGLGYALSATGADHCHNIHDSLYNGPSPELEEMKSLGILEPLPLTDLGPAKVRLLSYYVSWQYLLNCLVLCSFVPLSFSQVVDLVQGVSGWNTSLWELMKVGERAVTMTRAFNIREGFGKEDDRLPERFFSPFASGPLQGVAIGREDFEQAKLTYYRMMGWDEGRGAPTLGKLEELGIDWVVDKLT